MKHDVFISFSFEDQSVAEHIVNTLLEQYGIISWICTRAIMGGAHYRSRILEAIKSASVVVFIQSNKAVLSNEIPKEIGLALKAEKTIIPFKIDHSKLIGDLEYELYGIQFIDGTYPEFEDRIRDLARAIYASLGRALPENLLDNINASEYANDRFSLQSHISECSEFFYGREELMSELKNSMRSGKPVFLQGMGGIGKSEMAKQYIKANIDLYDTVVFSKYTGSLASMLADDDIFHVDGIHRKIKQDGQSQTDEEYAHEKLALIKRNTDERTLLIIDNYDVLFDAFLTEITTDRQYHLLFTTRCDQDRKKYCVLKVPEIPSNDALKDIVLSYCNQEYQCIDRNDPAFYELFELTNRHTFTLELISQYMEEHSMELSEIVGRLREKGIAAFQGNSLVHDASFGSCYELIKSLFHMEGLTDNEQLLLRELALMPITGISQSLFRGWCGEEYSCRTGLIKRSWIKFDSRSGLMSFHPIIFEIVREELAPSLQNCIKFLNSFITDLDENKSWNYEYEKKQAYLRCCQSIWEYLGDITKENYSLHFKMAVFMNFADQYTDMLTRWEFLKSACASIYGLDSREAALLYQRIGFLYYYSGKYDEAISLYECYGLDLIRKYRTDFPDAYVHTLCDCANAYYFRFRYSSTPTEGLLSTAENLLDEAQCFIDTCWPEEDKTVLRQLRQALVYNTRVKLLHERNASSVERSYLEKAYSIIRENPLAGPSDLSSVLRNLGKANMQTDPQTAISFLQESVDIYHQQMAYSSSYLDALLSLGSSYSTADNPQMARQYWNEAYRLASQLFVVGHPTLQAIEKLLK